MESNIFKDIREQPKQYRLEGIRFQRAKNQRDSKSRLLRKSLQFTGEICDSEPGQEAEYPGFSQQRTPAGETKPPAEPLVVFRG